jgi:hypothetical protein
MEATPPCGTCVMLSAIFTLLGQAEIANTIPEIKISEIFNIWTLYYYGCKTEAKCVDN